jgi:HK97 family phage prohead protease
MSSPTAMCVRGFDFRASESGDGRTLEGYAAVFDKPTLIHSYSGNFEEVIRKGAFERSLAKRTPVLLFEHGMDSRVGMVPIGAIEDIRERSEGLYVRARLYDNPVVQPIQQAIAGRSIKGMSFRFGVPDGGDKWTKRKGQPELREVFDTETVDVGPVVYPAYDQTSVTVRSMLAALGPDERRALIEELANDIRAFTGQQGALSAAGGAVPAISQENGQSQIPDPSGILQARDRDLRIRGILR